MRVKNPNNVSKGVKKNKINGNEIEGNIIPINNDNKIYKAEVIMG